MHSIFEAIFVGIYTWFLYILLSHFLRISSFTIFFFILGFLKHFLGGVLQLHSYYCNYGDACTTSTSTKKYAPIDESLFLDSWIEGVIFVCVFLFSYRFCVSSRINPNPNPNPTKIPWIWVFSIGFFLHILFEYLGGHRWFCKNRCKR